MSQDEGQIEELIAGFACLDTDEKRRTFILDHPAMISSPVVQAALRQPLAIAMAFLKTINVAGGRVTKIDEGVSVSFNADRYPVGQGPIEQLWRQVETKKILLAFAIEQVRRPAFSSNLTFVYIKALCDHCRDLMETARAFAFGRQRVVVEATEALVNASTPIADDEAWQMRCAAAHTWLEVVSAYLVDVADPRIFNQVTTFGERLIEECKRRNDQTFLPKLLQRMGVLHLDPYTATRNISNQNNFRFSLQTWQERLRDYLGAEYDKLNESERRMPDPEVALAAAEKYLRVAAQLQNGSDKAYTVTALIQAVRARQCLGAAGDQTENVALIDESIAALTPGKHDEQIIRLKIWRANITETNADLTEQVQRFVNVPIASIVEDLGAQGTIDAVSQLVNSLANEGSNNAAGLRIIERFREVFASPGVIEERRAQLWYSEIRLLRGWYSGTHSLSEKEVYSRPVQVGPAQFHGPENLTLRDAAFDKRIAELLTVALGAGEGDREEEGLAAIAKAIELDETLLKFNYDALTYMTALLSLGAGANTFNRRELSKAVEFYIRALALCLILGQTLDVHKSLQFLEDVVTEFDYAATFRLIRALGHFTNDVEVLTGMAGAQRLQSIYRKASSLWLAKSGKPAIDIDTVFLLFRLAKGCRFARCMRSDRRYDWRSDQEALQQLEAIRQSNPALGARSADLSIQGFRDPELLLIGHSGLHELMPGSSEEQQYENLRLAFDDYLSRHTAAEGIGSLRARWAELDPWAPPDLVSVADIQAAIDHRTVIVDYYLGQGRDQQPMLYALCITSDEAALFGTPVGHLESEEIVLNESGARAVLSPVARLVREARTAVNSIPGLFRVVSRDGEQALQQARQVLFGKIDDFLRTNRASGRDHICVVPHGALHFMPAHLLGPVDAALGTEWIVTYLPVIELLTDRRDAANANKPAATTVGLDFKHNIYPNLLPLERAPESAREVASLLGGQALINRDATKSNVVGALPRSRHFHLFTHGEQCIYAAAFHAVYLSPDSKEKRDGVLEAYQLLPLDLRTTEVLTLSACETALGRFDIGDNVMGLPGCLLFAGVKTILGTLWPVSAPVAERFFSIFYSEIKNDKPKLTAFELAQRTARSEFPEYRDWGAFYFVGRW